MNSRRNWWVCAFLFVLLSMSQVAFSEAVCDFDGNSAVNDNDLAILIGWKQLINAGVPAAQITTANLLDVSKNILTSVAAVTRIPDLNKDNLTDEANDAIDDEDLAFFIAYKQLENAGISNFSFENVKSVALNILSNLTRSMGKAPGMSLGDSASTFTITGIQVDP